MNIETPIYPFSGAPIWELQRNYYEEQGINAWRDEEVPHYITSNPVIAKSYAEMIFAFLKDINRASGSSDEPVYILELGAGSGRLAYHLLKHLEALVGEAGAGFPSFCYVMSDLPTKNVEYWQRHRSLLPFVERGLLDFARFDAVHDQELHLLKSGKRIGPGGLAGPIAVVANYFFDSIPQELFYVYNEDLYECWVSFPNVAEWDSLEAKALLESLEPEYHYRLEEGAYKESPALRSILEMYRRDLQESHFLFPYLGIACLERLRALSQQGILLLTADKGDHRLDYWSGRNVPELICHGSFSLTANYHALQHFYQAKGAATHFTKHHYSHINIGCLVMVPDATSYKETSLAYKRFIEQFGPDDYYSIKTLIDRHLDTMELEHLLAYIRLSSYDALLFKQCVPRLLSLIPGSNDVEKEDLQRMIQRVWEMYFPIEEKRDLAFDCGMLLCMLGGYEAALVFFQHSLDHYEEHVAVHYNRAMCYYELGDKEQAKHAANNALRLEPEHAGSLALLDKMHSEGE